MIDKIINLIHENKIDELKNYDFTQLKKEQLSEYFIFAIKESNLPITKLLYEKGAKIDLLSCSTILNQILIYKKNSPENVNILKFFADTGYKLQEERDSEKLYYGSKEYLKIAIENDFLDIVEILREKFLVDYSNDLLIKNTLISTSSYKIYRYFNKDNNDYLLDYAKNNNFQELKDLILNNKDSINIDFTNSKKWTALMYAGQNKNNEMIKFLLENGADHTLVNDDKNDFDIIVYKLLGESSETYNLLKNIPLYTTKLDKLFITSGSSLLNYIIQRWPYDIELINSLAKKTIDINKIDSMGYSPLAYSVLNGAAEVAKILLNNGALNNQICKDNFSILHHILANKTFDNTTTIKIIRATSKDLINWRRSTYENRMDPNGGMTPNAILVASQNQWDLEVVEELLKIGANPQMHMWTTWNNDYRGWFNPVSSSDYVRYGKDYMPLFKKYGFWV